jgi:parallel beta helix pectate lyase-like protein
MKDGYGLFSPACFFGCQLQLPLYRTGCLIRAHVWRTEQTMTGRVVLAALLLPILFIASLAVTPESDAAPAQTASTFTLPANGIINKPGTYTGTRTCPTSNRWAACVQITADNVTLTDVTINGGGVGVYFHARQNVTLRNVRFSGYSGGPIWMTGAVRNILIEGNSWMNTANVVGGFIAGRGSEGANPCPTVGRYVTIRNNVGDQGSRGWFGIELKCFEDVTIEGNSLKGGEVLISLPDSNRVTVRSNTLDLRGRAYWGIEVAKAHDVKVLGNTFIGDEPNPYDAVAPFEQAISLNSGSVRTVATGNRANNLHLFFAGPNYSTVTDNCLQNVKHVHWYGNPSTSTIARNTATDGPC